MTSRYIKTNYKNYGFFAGTMFWARLNALVPVILQEFTASNFESEKGQIDTTFAHALERAFCLCSEVEDRVLYEVDNDGVYRTNYSTTNIPKWSRAYWPKRIK